MNRKIVFAVVTAVILAGLALYGAEKAKNTGSADVSKKSAGVAKKSVQVTFVELGSVRCVPCKMMQPIMKQVETNYVGKVKVVFHDVWTPAGQPAAEKYRIKLIPTQVFLDASGKEFFRHEGFFAYEEIRKILAGKGVMPNRESESRVTNSR